MADALAPSQILDVELQEFTGPIALMSPYRPPRLQGFEPPEPHPRQPSGDRGAGETEPDGDVLAGQAVFPAQLHRPSGPQPIRSLIRARAGGALLKTSCAFRPKSGPAMGAPCGWRCRSRLPPQEPAGLLPEFAEPSRLDQVASFARSGAGCSSSSPAVLCLAMTTFRLSRAMNNRLRNHSQAVGALAGTCWRPSGFRKLRPPPKWLGDASAKAGGIVLCPP
ncbi:hypothetical protein [Geminicoccus roseus]|nr:hypothetical protein [Geminicoccus roseus]